MMHALAVSAHHGGIAMTKRDIHVLPGPDGWVVRREGDTDPLAAYDTKDEAMTAGRERARADRVELVEHGRDGKIRNADSYGNDPRNVRG
jgi:hypothetical protein